LLAYQNRMGFHQHCLRGLVNNYLLSKVQSCFWNSRIFSSKSDGNFWQSVVLHHKENQFLCIVHTHQPVLALNSCYVIFTGSIFVISHTLILMMSQQTGIPFCLWLHTNWTSCSSAS
jgi:hypothetical protein